MVGQLTQAFGCAARGRTERNTVIHSLIQCQNRIDRCCFAGAGAAGQDHHPAGQRQPDRLLLQRCIGETLCDLQRAYVGVQRLGGLGREGRKLPEAGGNILLRSVEIGQIDILRAVKGAGAQLLG